MNDGLEGLGDGTVLALSGGVGGAKLAAGLADIVPAGRLAICANVADDFEHLGLHVAPDIDSLLYGLSGRNDEERGWGRRGESWQFMAALRELGAETWFNLGDLDLATHVARSHRLRHGETLSQVTADFARAYGIEAALFPVSDDPVRTIVLTDEGEMPFQHYFVARQCAPKVSGFRYDGATQAALLPALAACCTDGLAAIVLCPSNPFISIDPSLAVPGLRDLLRNSGAPVVAVSPIVGGEALKGPAAKMLREQGFECSALGIARHYGDLIDGMIVDADDAALVAAIEDLGLAVAAVPSVMRSAADRSALARACLALAGRIGGAGSDVQVALSE